MHEAKRGHGKSRRLILFIDSCEVLPCDDSLAWCWRVSRDVYLWGIEEAVLGRLLS